MARDAPASRTAPSPLLRAVFVFLAALALTIGGTLILFPEGTGASFAWTIRAPIAAATLGAWFLGLGFFAASLARAPRWEAARLAVPTIGLGAAFLLLATLIHRAAFNWGSPAAWLWLILYIVAPPGFLGLYLANGRASPPLSPAGPSLTSPLRSVLRLAAAAYAVCGGLLFAWPPVLLPYWPLMPLGARAHAAFVLSYAAGSWLVARTRAAQAAAMPLYPFALLPLLAFGVPWLHADIFRAASPGGLVYNALTGGIGLALAWAIRAERFHHRSAQGP